MDQGTLLIGHSVCASLSSGACSREVHDLTHLRTGQLVPELMRSERLHDMRSPGAA